MIEVMDLENKTGRKSPGGTLPAIEPSADHSLEKHFCREKSRHRPIPKRPWDEATSIQLDLNLQGFARNREEIGEGSVAIAAELQGNG